MATAARRAASALLCALLLPLLLPAAGGATTSDWREREVDPATWSDGPTLEGSPMDEPVPGNPVLVLEVDYVPTLGGARVRGEVTLELFHNWAPVTVENMVGLLEDDFYAGTIFHRIIDDFVVQGGDPNTKDNNPANDGSGGSSETIPLEIDENLTHVDGAMGMARDTEPDSASSQFYICDGEQHGLDDAERQQRTPPENGYAVFGVVRDGMTHVRAMAAVPTTDKPVTSLPRVTVVGADRPIEDVRLLDSELIGVVMAPVDNGTLGPAGSLDGEHEPVTPFSLAMYVAVCALAGVLAWQAGKRL